MSQQSAKTFENDSYAVDAQEEAGCRSILRVIVKPQAAQKAYRQAVKIVNKQISIPGFRKGRAPDATVIARYGSYVEQEWKEVLIKEAYRAAVELADVYPMNKESIERPKIESCSQEEGATIRFAFERYPLVPEIVFSDLALPKIEKTPISEEKVLEIADEIRRSYADWEDVEGRAVIEGDFVDVTIDAIETDPPKPIVKDRRLEVTDKRMSPWLRKLVTGLHPNQTAEGMSEVDEQAEEHIKKKFKPTQLRVTLHAIKKILLPELNDELAKKVGAESKENLFERIRHNLEQEAEEEQKQKQIEALEEALLEQYHFDLPASIVERERRERIKGRIEALKDEGLTEEEIKDREKEIEEEVANDVDKRIRLYFLNKKIAQQGNISLTNQELNDEVVRQIQMNPQYYGKDMDSEGSREFVSRLASSLLQRKTKDYALSQVLAKAS